jgi:hypothetical protein
VRELPTDASVSCAHPLPKVPSQAPRTLPDPPPPPATPAARAPRRTTPARRAPRPRSHGLEVRPDRAITEFTVMCSCVVLACRRLQCRDSRVAWWTGGRAQRKLSGRAVVWPGCSGLRSGRPPGARGSYAGTRWPGAYLLTFFLSCPGRSYVLRSTTKY